MHRGHSGVAVRRLTVEFIATEAAAVAELRRTERRRHEPIQARNTADHSHSHTQQYADDAW